MNIQTHQATMAAERLASKVSLIKRYLQSNSESFANTIPMILLSIDDAYRELNLIEDQVKS